MWWPPVGSPEDSQQEPGGPVPKDVSAEETLSSVAEEVLTWSSPSSPGGRGRQPPGSPPSTPESKPESGKPTTSSEEADGRAVRELCARWIAHLRGKGADYDRCQSACDLRTQPLRLAGKERKALQSFCTIKVDLLRRRVHTEAKTSGRPRKQQLRWDAETAEGAALHCIVPDELLSRIYFKNTQAALKQMSDAKLHSTSQCPDCNSKRAELALYDFLRQKTTLLRSLLLQEKIDDQLYTTDFLTRVGEAHQGLPRLSEDPRLIWKRLNEKTQVADSGFERTCKAEDVAR